MWLRKEEWNEVLRRVERCEQALKRQKGVVEMSELVPCENAMRITDRIMELFIEEKMTYAEIADVPAELARRINKNTSDLKKKTVFTGLQ